MAKRAKPGRPRALETEAARKAVLTLLKGGASRADAAAKLGITHETIANEAKRDASFSASLMQAEAEGKIELIGCVQKAAKTEWRAALALLERKWYREWAKRDPESVSPDQLAHVISNVVAVLLTEIPQKYHTVVREKIGGIVAWLSGVRGAESPEKPKGNQP